LGPNETRFRVWAPKAQHVDLVLEESIAKYAKRTFHPLQREESGYFSGSAEIGAGARYRFRVNNANIFIPIRPRVFSPMVRTVLRALSIQPSSNGATRHGPEKN